MHVKTLHIEFTTSCNSKCIMCDYWKNSKSNIIDSNIVLDCVSELYQSGLKTVYFTGGECLIYAEKLFLLCKHIKEQYPLLNLGLITNGLLLEKNYNDVVEHFSKIIVSLDAVDPEIYKSIRGVDGLETIKKGIRLIKYTNNDIKLNLRIIVMQENVKNIPAIIDFGLRNKVDRISFIPEDKTSKNAFGRNKFETTNNFEGKSDAYLSELQDVTEYIRSAYQSVMGNILRPNLEDLEHVISVYSGNKSRYPKCNKASASCVISSEGKVNPCFFIEGDQFISHSVSLKDIISSKEYLQRICEINKNLRSECLWCACPKELL